jgi:hypothetical protein
MKGHDVDMITGINVIVNFVETEEDAPTETAQQYSGGWLRRLIRRVRLGLSGDDETLVVMNRTNVAWSIYHDYHQLGIVDAREEQAYHLTKHGNLNVRPFDLNDQVEYLVLPLNDRLHRVRIYRRQLSKDVEVYDMRPA